MFARKLMHLMAALAVGLVGFGVVLADDGPPQPPAEPTVPPLVAAPSLPTNNDEARLKAHAKALAGVGAKGERMILVQAMCMDVPAGFCEEVGLEEKQSAWSLSAREARMFKAILRAQKEKGAIDIISQPQLVVQDNQTGFAQVGQNYPYTVHEEVKGKDGKAVTISKIEYQPVGVTLKITPRIMPDGKSMLLRVDTGNVEVSPTPVDLGNGVTSPAFNAQQFSTTIMISDTGTAVICAETALKPANRKKLERVWVLTTHMVEGNAVSTSGTKRPVFAKPRVPVPPAAALPIPVVPAMGLQPAKPVTPMILPNPPHP